MKRHQTGPPKKRTALPLCMCAVLAVTGLACVPDSGGWLYNTALISAGLLMPEGGSRLLEDRLSTLSSSTAAAPASPSDPCLLYTSYSSLERPSSKIGAAWLFPT